MTARFGTVHRVLPGTHLPGGSLHWFLSNYLMTGQVVEKCMRLVEEQQSELENESPFVPVDNDPELEKRMRFQCAMYFRGLISSIQKGSDALIKSCSSQVRCARIWDSCPAQCLHNSFYFLCQTQPTFFPQISLFLALGLLIFFLYFLLYFIFYQFFKGKL